MSEGPRPSFHRTRTVAWAACEARLDKDGTGWTPSSSASEDKLDVHVLPAEEAFAVARNGAGIEELAARLAARGTRSRRPGEA